MTFKIIQPDQPRILFHSSVQLDFSRDTAILIRQSRRGSHVAHYESRLLQESLIPFVKQARGEDDLTHIRIFDEGSGVSGTKGPDKRKKVKLLLEQIESNLIGDLVMARADRLFRDKHFSNVGAFTPIAEKMGLKVIVPTPQGAIVYDLRKDDDLKRFQDDMRAAYAYVGNQIAYMNRAKDNKMARGFYGGGCLPLPYVLLRDMPKETKVPVIYDPWREVALELFQKFKEFNYEKGRMARFIEDKPYLFHYMPDKDLEEYLPVTTMQRMKDGYTFADIKSVYGYLSNLTLAGFAHGGKDADGNTLLIPGAFDAAIPLELLEPSFAAITGQYLDGTPYLKTGTVRQYRRDGEKIDAILHGLLTSDQGQVYPLASREDDRPCYACCIGGYMGYTTRSGLGRVDKAWELSARWVDRIVLDRLIALAEYDNELVERVKAYFGEMSKEGKSTLEVLDTAIRSTERALKKVNRAIVLMTKPNEDEEEEEEELDPDNDVLKEFRKLQAQLRNLQKQRDEAALKAKEDPAQSITDFYYVLSHLRAEFNTKPAQTKKDIMKKLIEEVKITSISPHLYTLHITWIQPMAAGREDVALLWRSDPTKSDATNIWTEEEEEAIRQLYPEALQIELMDAIPHKTPGQIGLKARELKVRRDYRHIHNEVSFYRTVAYQDLMIAAAFTETMAEKSLLWREINNMASNTRRGQLSVSWFLPVDMISFSRELCTTGAVEEGLPKH